MSFDDYANHIYQKHRLAVALGIIKSKPPNIPTTNYLEQLKSVVEHKMDDDDVTICSDDFLMDDGDDMNDSVTILKDFDLDNLGHEAGYKDFGEARNGERSGNYKAITISKDSSQTTYNDTSQTQFTPNVDYETTDITIYDENHKANQNFNTEQSVVQNNARSNEEFNATSNSDDNTINKTKSNSGTKESNTEIKESVKKAIDYTLNTQNMDLTYYDSQKTILYTVHGFTQNDTHYSPSQNDMVIPSKYIHRIKRADQNKDRNEANKINNNSEMYCSKNVDENMNKTQLEHTENILGHKICEKPSDYKEFELSQTMDMFSRNNDDSFNKIQDDLGNQNSNFNNETDRTKNNINTYNKDEHRSIQNFTQYAQNIDEYFQSMQSLEENATRKANIHSEYTVTEILNDTLECNKNINSVSSQNEIEKRKILIINKPQENRNFNTNSEVNNQLTEIANFPQNSTEHEEEIGEDTQEIISYKVLGEFNKVKTYLNRPNRRISCDGYSTDSGYRSDSQNRSNKSALQLSGNWLNQSGCCIYNYIIQCPLVAGTRDITNEIAQVLGQLIDKLHEEENYPSFLEDILETVDVLLRHVYEGTSSEDNEFLKKDESIQRILLLNKSIHIQKHTIEKISNILETFHLKITETDATYELSNIDKVENISYIFHILEILLKKYLKTRDLLSQSSTQLSQDEDKPFKKSSITDIWRKKWNPSQKVFEGSREKKCVLKLCGDVLNKIVVDCVHSYSLVAYSALKCFNSMQT